MPPVKSIHNHHLAIVAFGFIVTDEFARENFFAQSMLGVQCWLLRKAYPSLLLHVVAIGHLVRCNF